MYIHEYLAKDILRSKGITTPRSVLVTQLSEVQDAYTSLGSEVQVVKAQVLSGARGKSGGIKICHSLSEVEEATTHLLGSTLVTPQNPDGLPVHSVLLEEGLPIERELYLSITIDRSAQSIAIIASTEGGGDIEEVALQTPEHIITENIHIVEGLCATTCNTIASKLSVDSSELTTLLESLYDIFISHNCNLIEINPLIVSRTILIPLDCKIEFDANALFKHPELANLRDESQENAKDIEAAKYGLNYISLDGEIACMVNGAGLAMATMDLIKHFGGTPANFLDVGGGTDSDKVSKAIEIIQSEPSVKAILINIFGGIVRCDLIAQGIIKALKTTGLTLPLVVRLEGTNAEIGLELLRASGLNIISENDLARAAKRAVKLAQS